MEEIPLQTVSHNNCNETTNPVGPLATIDTGSLSRNNEQRLLNNHVSFCIEKSKSITPIIWFNSRNKTEKLCIVLSCFILFFVFVLLVSYSAITNSRGKDCENCEGSNDTKSSPESNSKPHENIKPQPIEIGYYSALILQYSLGFKSNIFLRFYWYIFSLNKFVIYFLVVHWLGSC